MNLLWTGKVGLRFWWGDWSEESREIVIADGCKRGCETTGRLLCFKVRIFSIYIYIYCAFGNYCILFKSDLFLLIFLSVYSEFLLTVEMGDLLLAKIGNDSKNWYRMDLDFQEK